MQLFLILLWFSLRFLFPLVTLFLYNVGFFLTLAKMDHSVRFRPRGNMRRILLDEEAEDFYSSLHRFDDMEKRLSTENGRGLSRDTILEKRHQRESETDRLEVAHFKMSFGFSQRAKRHVKVLAMAAHPEEPFFVSGGDDGSIFLWVFGEEASAAEYVHSTLGVLQSKEAKHEATSRETEREHSTRHRASSAYSAWTKRRLPDNKAKITRIAFNGSGSRFCVADADGYVSFYRFHPGDIALYPYLVIKAHKRTSDVCFLNNGTTIATGGHSPERDRNLCVWDTLLLEVDASLPATPEKAFGADELHEGVSSVCFISKHSLLFAGCRRGQVVAFSLLHNNRVRSIYLQPLLSDVRALRTDREGTYLAAGGKEGDLKVWHVDTLVSVTSNATRPAKEHAVIDVAHEKKTFFKQGGHSAISTYGLTDLLLLPSPPSGESSRDDVTAVYLYSCGADGRVCCYGVDTE